MDAAEIAGIVGAGVLAGGINAIVGSGSLITFPTLLAFGYPSVLANVSNTVGIWPGAAAGAYGYRRELSGQRGRVVRFGACTTAGALLGGVLLLVLPAGVFAAVVPVLILLACALMAVQPALVKRLDAARGEHRLRAVGYVGAFLTGVYGGYFGAAQGVILLALLAVVLEDGIQRLNGLKNVLAAIANIVSAILFVAITQVAWGPAGLIAVGSIAGGLLGARAGRRIPARGLRWTVVTVGTAVAVILFIRG